MDDDLKQGITDDSKILCTRLLASKYTTPKDTLFCDDVFPTACRNLRDKNEARVIQDIARLLVPSPESLAAFGAKEFNVLTESVTRAGTIAFKSRALALSPTLQSASNGQCSPTIN